MGCCDEGIMKNGSVFENLDGRCNDEYPSGCWCFDGNDVSRVDVVEDRMLGFL